MSRQVFDRSLLELQSGIDACFAKKVPLPTLVLLYSAIDVAAWLSNDDPAAGVGKRFMAWVDQYMLTAKPLACTSADIYGARCGLVHKLAPDSDMSDRGKARQVCYAWGDRSADALQALAVRAGVTDRYVCLQIEDLYEAWQLGLGLLVKEMDRDPARQARILARAGKFFDTDSTDTLDRCIERAKSG